MITSTSSQLTTPSALSNTSFTQRSPSSKDTKITEARCFDARDTAKASPANSIASTEGATSPKLPIFSLSTRSASTASLTSDQEITSPKRVDKEAKREAQYASKEAKRAKREEAKHQAARVTNMEETKESIPNNPEAPEKSWFTKFFEWLCCCFNSDSALDDENGEYNEKIGKSKFYDTSADFATKSKGDINLGSRLKVNARKIKQEIKEIEVKKEVKKEETETITRPIVKKPKAKKQVRLQSNQKNASPQHDTRPTLYTPGRGGATGGY